MVMVYYGNNLKIFHKKFGGLVLMGVSLKQQSNSHLKFLDNDYQFNFERPTFF